MPLRESKIKQNDNKKADVLTPSGLAITAPTDQGEVGDGKRIWGRGAKFSAVMLGGEARVTLLR